MGQILSEPVTDKETYYCGNELYRVGSSCMQGWRTNMEDAHTHILSLPNDPDTAFFAVYDGHGGAAVAQYAGEHLHKVIVNRREYPNNIPEAMKQAFFEIDEDIREKDIARSVGSTALTCLIKDRKLYCANAGDSRGVADINSKYEVLPLSADHKPNKRTEFDRITNAGGFVTNNRVNGNLALSRALGDFMFKDNKSLNAENQIVTACPDVVVADITDEWNFVLLACDGIWDVLGNREVVNFCRKRIADGMSPDRVCEELLDACLASDLENSGRGSDNMTVVLICFLHGRPYDSLVERCKESLQLDVYNELLPEPVTHIDTNSGQNEQYYFASSHMQGWKVYMESFFTNCLSLSTDKEASYFGVFDGIYGQMVAERASDHLHFGIVRRPEYPDFINLAIQQGIREFDNEMDTLATGASARLAICLIRDDVCYFGHSGNVLTMIGHMSDDVEVIPHATSMSSTLSLPYGLDTKKNFLPNTQIREPSVEKRDINDEWNFVILTSPLLSDAFSGTYELIQYCYTQLGKGVKPEVICESMLNKALIYCQTEKIHDRNLFVTLICFLQGKSFEEYKEKLKSSIAEAKMVGPNL